MITWFYYRRNRKMWLQYTVLFILIPRDLLFREIYDKFSEDPVGKVVFLESLEPHILADK